ncbi:MAG TPA: DNA-binding protein, partial [Xanthobacteraceae bacterium]|nr:DNA-binding protein [Xanthobacteraceae bacterium]
MNESEAQEPVFALLAEPATHGGAAVKRIDTHAASVFLAGPRTFKVKRAVRFPFLDYSTLDRRKQACEAEL